MSAQHDRETRRLRVALGMFQAGVDMMRQNLRRADPSATDTEIRIRVGNWLRERPGGSSETVKAASCPGPDRPEVIEGLRLAVAKTGHLLAMKLLAMDDARRPQTRPDI
jgi:hypothetical protein